jgi:tubulin---tyrosine ligase
MIPGLLSEDGLPIMWTRVWRNTYNRLFKAYSPNQAAKLEQGPQAGPDSMQDNLTEQEAEEDVSQKAGSLLYKFSPDLQDILHPKPSTLPEGTDTWALERGWVSVAPLRASFGEPVAENIFTPGGSVQDRIWKNL